jgi:hypothetical protein
VARRFVWSRNLENEEAKARYWAVKIQPQWVVTPGKQTNKQQQQQQPSKLKYCDCSRSEGRVEPVASQIKSGCAFHSKVSACSHLCCFKKKYFRLQSSRYSISEWILFFTRTFTDNWKEKPRRFWSSKVLCSGSSNLRYSYVWKKTKRFHLQGLVPPFICVNMPVYVVCFLLRNSPASEIYMLTFRNTLSVPSS